MKPKKYLPYIPLMFLITGCTRLREWEKRGSPDNLPEPERSKWYQQNNIPYRHYQWMQEEINRR